MQLQLLCRFQQIPQEILRSVPTGHIFEDHAVIGEAFVVLFFPLEFKVFPCDGAILQAGDKAFNL